ncbi:hypothetical protein BASA60_003158, partial [Batrachochytrium salamandrivorans]
MLVSSVISLLAIGFISISAANYITYNLLKNDRAAGRLIFIPTSLEQKEIILSNVESTLAIWVNYDSKKAKYGSAADPFPTIKKLRETINTVSDEELQLGLTDAFIMTRDRHTRWTNMPPYRCFYVTTGVKFTFIEGDADIAKKPTVVVTSTAKHPDLLALFGEDYSKIQAGDELLAINGLSFVEWFEKNKFTSGAGANESGGQRAALDYLTTIYGESIVCQMKTLSLSSSNSELTPIPAILSMSRMSLDAMRNVGILGTNCTRVSLVKLFLEHLKRVCLLAQSSLDIIKSQTPHTSPPGVYEMDSPEDPERGAAMEQMSNSRQESVVLMNPTDVTKITWGIYQPKSTNMGVIKLDSFSPEDVDTKSLAVEKAVMVIRSLLANELKDTHSVMYELRGNSGGSVKFANSMVQLFKPDFQPFGDRYLMNQITQNIFVDNKNPNVDPFAKAWQETELKQSIQGHGAGTIFGEDKQTGGGGATVVKLDPFLILYRTGRYNGQDIEDAGIEPEIIVRPRWSDLQPDSPTNTQYDRIAEHLARIGQENSQSKLHFVCEPFDIEKPLGKFSLKVESAGIEKFTVFQADGETVIAKKKKWSFTKKQRFSISVSAAGSTLGNNRITIVGKTAGVQVLKTKRNVRTIPTNDKYMKIST